ncbi:metallophosphoesterase [Austwickia chelonae]|uniref:metallophosphoesterase n=1 Tax=Austwickia chelonae TaxID=100225 RepID=UPI000E28149F|nr:metallophosphoesterase [Austwickia chelonae]
MRLRTLSLAAATACALSIPTTFAAAQETALSVVRTGPNASPAGHSAPDGAFRDPATYDLAIAHITDTQYLTRCANGSGILPSIRERCQDIYEGMNQWIVDNAGHRKIAYTAHTGDLIDSYTLRTKGLARGEFARASEAQRILDDAGMPNGVLPGNHDNLRGKDASVYNEFFGPDRYTKASAKAAQPYYQGPWKPGDNSNHVDEFHAGGVDFAVVHLGYQVTEEEAAWANQQIAARPGHNVIVATHAYLKPGPAPDGEGAALSTDGARVRSQVVDPNPNVFLVISGHEHGVGRNIRQGVGPSGRQVVELMADYQAYNAGSDGNGHAGFIRMLQLDVRHGEMTVDTYSPSLNSFRSRDYDTKPGRHYDGNEDEFTVPVHFLRPVTAR